MWKLIGVLAFSSLTLMACNVDEALEPEEHTEEYEPMEYRGDTGIERRGQIPTGKDSYFKRTAEKEFRDTKYKESSRARDNAFNNEDAMEVVEKVNELKEVTLTQAFTTDDKVYIAVMVNPYDNRDHTMSARVRAKAKEVTDKQAVIWINNNNWDNMKDLNARLKSSKAPDDIKERIAEFFNQGRD